MGWLKGSGGSTGSLTLAENPARSEGAASPSGWTGKQAGRPQSVALQRRSGGAGLPVLDGKPRQGRSGHRSGSLSPGQRPERAAGDTGTAPFFQYSPLGLNASVRRQCYWKNGKNGKSCALIPTASRPQGICQNGLPKSEMATRIWEKGR